MGIQGGDLAVAILQMVFRVLIATQETHLFAFMFSKDGREKGMNSFGMPYLVFCIFAFRT
jgi:hypothetical protein